MAVVAMVVVATAATMGHVNAQGINADLISCDASNPNQQWMYHPGSDNHIVLKHNGWCLDVEDYGTTPGKACHRSTVWAMPDSERSHTSTPPAAVVVHAQAPMCGPFCAIQATRTLRTRTRHGK